MSKSLNEQIRELAEHMRRNPHCIEKPLLDEGKGILSIYIDVNYGPSLQSYQSLLQELFLNAAFDLSHGAPVLSSHVMGILFRNGKLSSFSQSFEESASLGSTVCTLKLKSKKAFNHYLRSEEGALDQRSIHAAIYLLASEIAKL